eukprot:snap_masked-scaffold_66-processed-gene-0.43-mRNA-1 protein AED:1.00 eAED:1.00 QI:0/0/0/0/1/1/2/0/84
MLSSIQPTRRDIFIYLPYLNSQGAIGTQEFTFLSNSSKIDKLSSFIFLLSLLINLLQIAPKCKCGLYLTSTSNQTVANSLTTTY